MFHYLWARWRNNEKILIFTQCNLLHALPIYSITPFLVHSHFLLLLLFFFLHSSSLFCSFNILIWLFVLQYCVTALFYFHIVFCFCSTPLSVNEEWIGFGALHFGHFTYSFIVIAFVSHSGYYALSCCSCFIFTFSFRHCVLLAKFYLSQVAKMRISYFSVSSLHSEAEVEN